MTKNNAAIRRKLEKELQTWTVIGPVYAPGAMDRWVPMPLDAARKPPAGAVAMPGARLRPRRMVLADHALDLGAALGGPAGTPQAFAFARFTAPGEGALSLRLDVDFYAVLWVDGREALDLRAGNRGGRHPVMLAVGPGPHTLTLRIISGTGGWSFRLDAVEWRSGVPDIIREDRGALWRNYARTVVRHENRPDPLGPCGGMPIPEFEHLMANLGVDARWISVDGGNRGLLYRSKYLPSSPQAKPEHETALKKWVALLHQRRISAMTWMSLTVNRPAWEAHPDWRQHFLVNPPDKNSWGHGACCVNSPYGDAMIGACIELLRKFDFDGIWFDASFLSPSWSKPAPVSCVCRHCAREFRKAAGCALPDAYDWSRPEFRRWVRWRYDMFSAYWQRLTDAVRRAVPEAAIVFNHYHRENTNWHSGIPLAPFGKGFISGTEADGEPLRGAFDTRLMRAYGRPDTEVWMGMAQAAKPTIRGHQPRPRPMLDFALACATAGGHASTGGGRGTVEGLVLGELARELRPRAPYLNLPSWPYAALHVSQQVDTFVFGRNPDYIRLDKTSWYWNGLVGWHHMLAHAGLNCDVIFDAHLDAGRGAEHALREYPLLLMPLAVALSSAQHRQVMRYVRAGGVLVAGPWFGVCDEHGEPRRTPLGDRALFPFGQRFPDWETLRQRPELRARFHDPAGQGWAGVNARPLAALPASGRLGDIRLFAPGPCLHVTRVGRGRIVQCALEPGMIFRQAPGVGLSAAARAWLSRLAPPPAMVDGGPGLIAGVFRRGRSAIVHVQQFPQPGDAAAGDADVPPWRWGVKLTWRGARPAAVHCCLPEPGPALPLRRVRGGWQAELPAFRWGQALKVQL